MLYLGSEQILRDIEKMNMAHDSNSRRIRRRKRGRSLYVLLVFLLAFAIIITLSMTVLFNIKTIRVTGNAEYSPEEIISAIHVSKGDNMMRLHLEALETAAEETLLDAETVDIQRQFPSTLVIDVTKAVPAYNISYESVRKIKFCRTVWTQWKDLSALSAMNQKKQLLENEFQL